MYKRPDKNVYTVESSWEQRRQRDAVAQNVVVSVTKRKHGIWEYVYADGSQETVSMDEHKNRQTKLRDKTAAYYDKTAAAEFEKTVDENVLKSLPPYNQQQPVLPERNPLSEEEQHLLALACQVMDSYLDDETERNLTVEGLNSVIVSRWGGLPLFEAYEDSQSNKGWSIGYRSNALEAFILPSDISQGSVKSWVEESPSPEELDDNRWGTRFGWQELDLILCMLASSEEDSLENRGWISEVAMYIPVAYVSNGKIYNDKNWNQLNQALAHPQGLASLPRAIPVGTTPLVYVKHYGVVSSSTVAGFMKTALIKHSYMEAWPASKEHEEMLQDMAFLANKDEEDVQYSDAAARQQRRQQGLTVIQDYWLALLEALKCGKALLPAWERDRPEDLIVVVNGHELSIQMETFYRANRELGLAPMPENIHIPALGPVPGQYMQKLLADYPRAETEEVYDEEGYLVPNPAHWWEQTDETTYQSAIGKWVAVSELGFPMHGPGHFVEGQKAMRFGPVKAYDRPEDAPEDPDRYALVFVPGEGKDGDIILNDGWRRRRP